jgi:hypothetical protein
MRFFRDHITPPSFNIRLAPSYFFKINFREKNFSFTVVCMSELIEHGGDYV